MNHFLYIIKDDVDAAVNNFAYVWYNHVQPHKYNKGNHQLSLYLPKFYKLVFQFSLTRT